MNKMSKSSSSDSDLSICSCCLGQEHWAEIKMKERKKNIPTTIFIKIYEWNVVNFLGS